MKVVRAVAGLPFTVWHLSARFVTSLPGHPPPTADEAWAEDRLTDGERALWRQMGNRDRRHSIAVARRFVTRRPDASTAEVAGALLHDVGKIECGLGTFARVAATILGPRTERFRAYHEHEARGADLVAAAGSEAATVELVAGTGPAYEDLAAGDHA